MKSTIHIVTCILCISFVVVFTFSFSKNKTNGVENVVARQKTDTFPNISLCGPGDRAFDIPYSIDLPRAQDIPGYRDSTTLIRFLQDKFDIFSWKTFIALNWPALKNGMPDSSVCFTSNAASAVWEDWMPGSRIFVDSGSAPSPWKTGTYNLNEYYGVNGTSFNQILEKPGNFHTLNSGIFSTFKISKVDSQFSILDAQQFPVIDKDHLYTLFEIFYNRQAYNYVARSKLYSKLGQQQFSRQWPSYTKGMVVTIGKDTMNIEKTFKRAYFPVGNDKDSSKSLSDTTFSFSRNEGAIIIKSAWVVLTNQTDFARYFTRTIRVKEKNGIKMRTIGLVAMHIMHKVAEVTQWVWSSFEHVLNAPSADDHGKAVLEPGVDYLYFDENNNDTSRYNKHADAKYQPDPFSRIPSQVVKLLPTLRSTDKITELFHTLIARQNKNSVWLNYRLVGTQWAFNPTLFQSGSDYQPALMANALMETYSQKGSSCMGCHSQARFLYNSSKTNFHYGYNSDFVWGLDEAK